VIVYADSSVLARSYLPDERGHREALKLLRDPDIVVVTGSWTRIEVAGALVRTARAKRRDKDQLLDIWRADTGPDGPITVITAPQEEVEREAFEIVATHGIRAMDAWHIATATLLLPDLAAGEPYAFASRDKEQAAVAELRGFTLV
jgi:predicted nucleic acid-binding protein